MSKWAPYLLLARWHITVRLDPTGRLTCGGCIRYRFDTQDKYNPKNATGCDFHIDSVYVFVEIFKGFRIT